MPVGNSGATQAYYSMGSPWIWYIISTYIGTNQQDQKSYLIISAYLPWHVTVDPMLQYPCASPRPRRGPGEVSSVSGLQLSTNIAPDLFLLVAAAGRSSSQLVSKVHDQAGHRHKTSPAPAQDHPLSSPAPAHPLSNTPQQGQVSSPRVRISNHKCGATVCL